MLNQSDISQHQQGANTGTLKWPFELNIIRHAESAYNARKMAMKRDATYQRFVESYNYDPQSAATVALAQQLAQAWPTTHSDYQTPLTQVGMDHARATGAILQQNMTLPDVVITSPYVRATQTLEFLSQGWPLLKQVKTYSELRLREQRHGLALLYGDWRVFFALHPEQRQLYALEGAYHYQYPQGDSVEDVQERILLWLSTLTREFAGQRVLVIAHHLTILAARTCLERLTPEQFLELDRTNKPANCSLTQYRGVPGIGQGKEGKLVLAKYNQLYC